MSDHIEKIVSKWGFKRNDNGNIPRFERWYRHFYFSIEIKPDHIEIFAIGKDEDNKPCQYKRTLPKQDYHLTDIGITDEKDGFEEVKYLIKGSIREFLAKFFKHDLFHDKDWKDGKG